MVFSFHFIFIYFHRVNTFSNYGYLLFYNVPCFKNPNLLNYMNNYRHKIPIYKKKKNIKRKVTLESKYVADVDFDHQLL